MTSRARALRPSGMYIVARERAGELTSIRAERAARWWRKGFAERSRPRGRWTVRLSAEKDDVWRGWWLARSTTLHCNTLLHASAAARRRGSSLRPSGANAERSSWPSPSCSQACLTDVVSDQSCDYRTTSKNVIDSFNIWRTP